MPSKIPPWLGTLRMLMQERGLNPRSLSLQAKLNETAVRDLLEGRARSPRYDTLKALAAALDVSPAYLMGDEKTKRDMTHGKINQPERLDLLTEIIARVIETADSLDMQLEPSRLAQIVSAVYQQLLNQKKELHTKKEISSHVDVILTYEKQVVKVKKSLKPR